MGHVQVHIWTGRNVDPDFQDSAYDAIEETLDGELPFAIDAYERDTDFDTDGNSWSDVKPHFVDYVKDKLGGDPPDDHIHMILIDDIWSQIGAGTTWGTEVQAPPTPWDTGEAAASGVNVAIKVYVNNNDDCAGDGGRVFKSTVIHEILHTMMDQDKYPNNDESDSGNDFPGVTEHTCGRIEVDADGEDDWVSPMQTWYSENNCGDNYDVKENCNSTENTTREGYSLVLSQCTKDEVSDYHDYYL